MLQEKLRKPFCQILKNVIFLVTFVTRFVFSRKHDFPLVDMMKIADTEMTTEGQTISVRS